MTSVHFGGGLREGANSVLVNTPRHTQQEKNLPVPNWQERLHYLLHLKKRAQNIQEGKTKQNKTPEQTRNLQKCCFLLTQKPSGLPDSARKKRKTSGAPGWARISIIQLDEIPTAPPPSF